MKKKILIIVIAFLIIFIVVLQLFMVRNKQIICTSNGETSTFKITQKYVFKYKNNDVTNMQIIKTYKYMDIDMFNNFKNIYDNTLSGYKSLNNKNLSYSGSILKDTYKIELTINVSKISTKDLENLGFNKGLNSMKTKLEDQGLKCA